MKVKTLLVAGFFALFVGCVNAQSKGNPFVNNDPEYTKVITQRADKIVASLQMTDSVKYKQVLGIMVEQFRYLSALHDFKNDLLKTAKAQNADEKRMQAIKDSAQAQLYVQHAHFLGQLAAELSLDDIDKIKDGMTYNVLHVTYTAQLDMIPTLTEEQKKYIYACLYEAREQSMDQASSNEKHGVFGKYKGRINNYLSAQGYDLTAERKAWEERKKARENK